MGAQMAAFGEPRMKVASFFVMVAAYLTLNTCLNLLSKVCRVV